ncbi:MAG: hypothetical protein M9929_14210 [Burkholderiaceae bacterium]|nr:hypothetical protein [Burkholderiaceae bacterium]
MKKFAMAAVAAAAMTAGVAQAYTAGTFSNGVVVPNVIHNGATDTTAVGLVNQSGATKAVFWTFFDQDSKHVTDGCFTMTDKDYHPFVWVNEAGGATAGKRGYLVFSLGGATCAAVAPTAVATDIIAAHAFQVNTTAQDVAYTPVIDGPLTFDPAVVDLTVLGPTSLIKVAGAAQTIPVAPEIGAKFSMRYFLDGGAATNIVVWSTGNQKGSHTVNIFDDKQNRKSVNFDLKFEELDWFDPAPIVGRPANFTDGFIDWDAALVAGLAPVAPATTSSVFSYSVISAPAFGAVQSVLGFHRN